MPRAPSALRAPMHTLSRHRAALALALLVAVPAFATPHILLFPVLGQPDEVAVFGRVLKQAPTSGSNTLSKNLRRLMTSDWEGAPVEVTVAGQTKTTRANDEGIFEVVFRAPELTLSPGLHEVKASVPGAAARSTVRVMDPKAPFFVVSDFDDTVAVTNVLSKRRLLKSALLMDSETQPAVPKMSAFYRCLIEDRFPTPGLAFVSGSPHQFASRIGGFLVKHQFPLSALYLRDLGPKTLSGYKQPTLRKLMNRMEQGVIFVGDSGEHDPEVYAEIRQEFPDRVLAIYIHDVGRTEDRSRFEGMVVFDDAREAAKDAVSKGFIRQACFDEAFGE